MFKADIQYMKYVSILKLYVINIIIFNKYKYMVSKTTYCHAL